MRGQMRETAATPVRELAALTAVSCPRAHTRGLMPVVRCPWSILPKEGCHAIVCYWSAAV